MPQTIRDIMTVPAMTIGMDTTMEQVQEILDQHGFHHLVVLGDEGRCAGVISDRDVSRTVSPFIGKLAERTADVNSLKRKAHQVMSRSLVTVRERTLLRAAARMMLNDNISCVPVVNADRRCIGIVTIRDIVRWAISRMECDAPLFDRLADQQAGSLFEGIEISPDDAAEDSGPSRDAA